jgi:hypothetical protein
MKPVCQVRFGSKSQEGGNGIEASQPTIRRRGGDRIRSLGWIRFRRHNLRHTVDFRSAVHRLSIGRSDLERGDRNVAEVGTLRERCNADQLERDGTAGTAGTIRIVKHDALHVDCDSSSVKFFGLQPSQWQH